MAWAPIALLLQALGGRSAQILVQFANDHSGAFFATALGNAQTDAATGADDYGHPVFQ
jgi:hypothetical protein